MATWKIILNWKGELHTFHTTTDSPEKATRNAIARLAGKLKVSGRYVSQYVYEGNRISVTIVEPNKGRSNETLGMESTLAHN